MSADHKWNFFRAGGFDQPRLDSGADLGALGQLDQKLWLALACPTTGLEFDPRTLEFVDGDKDGRIRAPDIISSGSWTVGLLKNPDDLIAGNPELPLAAIREDAPEGKALVDAARALLQSMGKSQATSITVEDATHAAKAFEQSLFNGDGVVPPESAPDDALRACLQDALASVGGEKDLSGKTGITAKVVETFFAELQAYAAWLERAKATPEVLPLGEKTATAAGALRAVKAKLDDYFARCRLAAFDARALQALNREEKEYLALAAKDLSITAEEVASFPLARIEASRPLPLKEGINPAWAAALEKARATVLEPLLGKKDALTEAEWHQVRTRFDAYEAWLSEKGGAAVEKLGEARIRELLAGNARESLLELVQRDEALKPVHQSIQSVERLVRLHRDLYRLCNNFVSFRDFYTRKNKAIFQAGTLYIDQRSCDLCIRVEDLGKHSAMAALSRTYIAYCECVRRGTNEKMTIAAAITDGDADNLMVGRNGVFYDRKGRDWDATVVKIVDNPISVRQSFWAPYKRVIRFVEEQISKRAAAADTAANERLVGTADSVVKASETGPKPATAPAKFDVGVVAAMGVAVGGITAALGALLQAFFGLGLWMPLGLVGLLLAISGPSMLVAWLKLRQRNLGPLLDANGWAINAAARMNVPFGGSLTRVATLPPGAQRQLADPFAEKPMAWKVPAVAAVILVFAGAWYLGKLDGYLPTSVRSVVVLGAYSPNAPAPAATGVPAPAPTAASPTP